MLTSPHHMTLPNADATARLGATVGPFLSTGDTLLLDGPVGAGKTHFARALIQSILTTPEDVPSPTFTIVQTYDTVRGPLWHTDLYRIADVSELDELGLTDAFEDSICLVEWPDKLGLAAPGTALTISFAVQGDARAVTLSWSAGNWGERLTDMLAHV